MEPQVYKTFLCAAMCGPKFKSQDGPSCEVSHTLLFKSTSLRTSGSWGYMCKSEVRTWDELLSYGSFYAMSTVAHNVKSNEVEAVSRLHAASKYSCV